MIAAYQRISRADGDLGKDGKDKSNSIFDLAILGLGTRDIAMIVLDEKIREGLMEVAERFLPPDDLKNKIMNKIKQ